MEEKKEEKKKPPAVVIQMQPIEAKAEAHGG